jgi:hypothetical protein
MMLHVLPLPLRVLLMRLLVSLPRLALRHFHRFFTLAVCLFGGGAI